MTAGNLPRMPPTRRAAIFDLDGTVIDCSSEKKFAAHLIEKGVVRFKDFARWFAHMLADLPRDPARALKANRSYLSGKPIDLTSRLKLGHPGI